VGGGAALFFDGCSLGTEQVYVKFTCVVHIYKKSPAPILSENMFLRSAAPLLRHQSPEGDGAQCDASVLPGANRLAKLCASNTASSQPGDAHAAGATAPKSVFWITRVEEG